MKHYAYNSPFQMKDNEGNEYVLTVEQEDYADNPRNWDNFCTMVCWHRRYNIGDKHGFSDPLDFMMDLYREVMGKSWFADHESDKWQDMLRVLNKTDLVLIKPINLYDHSGITISTSGGYPYNDRWDSCCVGFIYVTKAKVLKEIANANEVNWTAIADEILENESETYDQYLRGETYWFKLTKKVIEQNKCPHCGEVICEYEEDEEIDSCGGFYGDCLEENGILDNIDENIKFLEVYNNEINQ